LTERRLSGDGGVAGRAPAPEPVFLDLPAIPPGSAEALARVLESGRLVKGPEAHAFEEEVAARLGGLHAVSCGSGTIAIELLLRALKVPKGALVAVPAFTFVAVAHSVLQAGATPMPLDVRASDLALDPMWLARAAEDADLWGAIVVDPYGLPVAFDDYERVSRDHGLVLIEDAACALGSADATGRPAGSRGRGATFSFHPRKPVTTGEGGMVVSADETVAEAVRRMANHGFDALKGTFVEAGVNGRLGELAAALGRMSLGMLEATVEARLTAVELYLDALRPLVDGGRLELVLPGAAERWNAQTLVALITPGAGEASRVRERAAARGIEIGAVAQCLPSLPSLQGVPHGPCATAAMAERQAVALPVHPKIGEEQVGRVAKLLEEEL
jgi:perosamine synthetase